MAHGAEIKVGLVALLAIALLLFFALSIVGFRVGGTYLIYADFPDALGLQQGDPVQMLGVRIGEVRNIDIYRGRSARATLAIQRKYPIYSTATIRVSTTGMLQEAYVDIEPAVGAQHAERVQSGQVVQGQSGAGLSGLMATGQQVLGKLDTTVDAVNQALAKGKLTDRLQAIVANLQQASEAGAELTKATARVARTSTPQVQGVLRNINLASADLEAVSREVRERLTKGPALANLETMSNRLAETAGNLTALTGDLRRFAGDPQIQSALRDIVVKLQDTVEQLRISSHDLTTITGEAARAAPEIPAAITSIGKVAGTVSDIQSRLQPPVIQAAFDVLAGSGANHVISSGRIDLGIGQTHFLRLGIDDIGEQSSASLQVGEHRGRRALRYGLIRGKLGVGFDVPAPRNGRVSVDVADPNRPHADVLGAFPVVSGHTDIDLLLGVRDLGQDAALVAGARFSR